jgi:hypothetical protein
MTSFNADLALKTEVGSYPDREWSGEIGTQEVTLYAKPLNPADVKRVRRNYPDFMTQPEPAAMVDMICDKVHDGNGKRVFVKSKHAPIFEQMRIEKVGDIFGALFGQDFDDPISIEDTVKNSGKTP